MHEKVLEKNEKTLEKGGRVVYNGGKAGKKVVRSGTLWRLMESYV